jgi:hypothetical protein
MGECKVLSKFPIVMTPNITACSGLHYVTKVIAECSVRQMLAKIHVEVLLIEYFALLSPQQMGKVLLHGPHDQQIMFHEVLNLWIALDGDKYLLLHKLLPLDTLGDHPKVP